MLNRIKCWGCSNLPRQILAKLGFESDEFWFDILQQYVNSDSKVLEIGAGSGVPPQNTLRPSCSSLTGVDFDERVLENSYLDNAYTLTSGRGLLEALEGERFEVIYSHMVAEHVSNPSEFLTQQFALLSEGGVIIHSTVSAYSFISMLNRVCPQRLKNFLIKNLGSGRTESDVFPAYYRLNNDKQVADLSAKLGFQVLQVYYDTGAGYFSQVPWLGVIYGVIQKAACTINKKLNGRLLLVIWRG